MLDVKVQRKSALSTHAKMRVEQQKNYRNLLEKDILLQSQLQGEENDLSAIRDARANIGSLVTQYIKTISSDLDKIQDGGTVKGEVMTQGKLLSKKINKLLDDVFLHMKKERIEADKQMAKLRKSIQRESLLEKKKKDDFDSYLKDEGEDPEDWKDPEERSHDYDDPEQEQEEVEREDFLHDIEEAESMRARVANFFASVEAAKHLKLKTDAELEKFEAYMGDVVMPAMEADDGSEVGAKKDELDATMNAMMKEAGIEVLDPHAAMERFASVIDSTKALKQDALFQEMHRRYTANETDAHGIVAELENLAEGAEYIPIEWLWDAESLDQQAEEEEGDEHPDEDHHDDEAGDHADDDAGPDDDTSHHEEDDEPHVADQPSV